jgi:predicted DNA-binding protein (MmcQ/YjbR family)
VSERIGGYGSASNKKSSVHVFKHNEKWYKVTTKIDERAVVDMKEDEIYSKTTK